MSRANKGITAGQKLNMRIMRRWGATQREIAAAFGISQSRVSRILRGK